MTGFVTSTIETSALLSDACSQPKPRDVRSKPSKMSQLGDDELGGSYPGADAAVVGALEAVLKKFAPSGTFATGL